MAKRRDRYVISGNMSANGKDLKGIILVDLGLCGFSGATTTKGGKKLLKSDMVYRKFKFEDPKKGKELGLPKTLTEFTFSPNSIPMFLTKLTEDNT